MICIMALAAQLIAADSGVHPVGGAAKEARDAAKLAKQSSMAPAVDKEPDEMDAPAEPWEMVDVDVDEESDDADRERMHEERLNHKKVTKKKPSGDMMAKLHSKISPEDTPAPKKQTNPVMPQPAQQQPQEVPEEDGDAALDGLHRSKSRPKEVSAPAA